MTKEQKTIIKLAAELMNDGMTITESLRAISGLADKYAAAMDYNLFSEKTADIVAELTRRNINAQGVA